MSVSTARCGGCHHHAHPEGRCQTHSVTGPPGSADGHPADHPGRTVTQCECETSTPEHNGHTV